MKILLVGGTDLTVAIATALCEQGMSPCGCVGVGSAFKISYSKVEVSNARRGQMDLWSFERGVPYLESTNTADIIAFAQHCSADLCIVAGWYHFVPTRLRTLFPLGTLGVHASLLPELRGGAPLNWAILGGLKRTGVTLFELGDGVDDGALYGQSAFPIGDETTIGDLVKQSTEAACRLVCQSMSAIGSGAFRPKPQTGTASYGLQRIPDDGRIDWSRPAEMIHRLVRSVSEPYPGSFTRLDDTKLVIWSVRMSTLPLIYGACGQIAIVPESSSPIVLTGSVPLTIERATDDSGNDALPLLLKANHKRFR